MPCKIEPVNSVGTESRLGKRVYTVLIAPFCPNSGVASELPFHSRPHGTVTVDDDLAKVDFWETRNEKPIISCQDAGGSKLVPQSFVCTW